MKVAIRTVGAFDAKTHLSRYLDEVEKGNCIEITRRGKRVAMLVSPALLEPEEENVETVIQRVRERRAKYNVPGNEIQEWRREGRA